MAANNTSKTTFNFAGGILSPELAGNLDLSKQGIGLLQAENVLLTSSGTLEKKTGTGYVADAKGPCVLREDVFNINTGYALEFGEKYIRFFKDGAQIIKTTADAWVTSTSYEVGNYSEESGTIYYCIEDHTSGTFATDLTDGKWVAQAIYEIPTNYTFEEASELKFAQTGNTAYVTHPSHPTAKLVVAGDVDWTLEDIDFTPDVEPGTFALSKATAPSPTKQFNWEYTITTVNKDGNEGLPQTSQTISADIELSTQNVTIAITPPAVVDNVASYRIYRKKGLYFYLIAIVTEDGSATYSKVDVGLAIDETFVVPEEFTDFTGENNYPAVCSFYNQRLVLGATNNKPNTIWFSRIGLYENFTKTPLALSDEGTSIILDSSQVNRIKNLVRKEDLICLTEGEVWRLKGNPNVDLIAYVESSVGSSEVIPVKTRKSLLFLQSNENTISDFIYNDRVAGFDGTPLMVYAKHLFEGYNIVDMAFSSSPEPRLYAIRDDGKIMCLTYLKTQDISGWTTLTTQGTYESICVVPKQGSDEIYFVVNRNGSRSIEILKDKLLYGECVSKSWYVDKGTRYDGAKTSELVITAGAVVSAIDVFSSDDVGEYICIDGTRYEILTYTDEKNVTVVDTLTVTTSDWSLTVSSLSGLDYLDGEDIYILADKDAYNMKKVVGGNIDLGKSYSRVTIGLAYEPLIETIPQNAIANQIGSTLGRKKRLNKIYVSFNESRAVSWKTKENGVWQSRPEQFGVALNQPVELKSGQAALDLLTGTHTNDTIFLKNDYPVPFNVLNFTIRMSYEGEN